MTGRVLCTALTVIFIAHDADSATDLIPSPASCPTHAASYAGTTNVVGRQGLGRDGPGGYAAVRDA